MAGRGQVRGIVGPSAALRNDVVESRGQVVDSDAAVPAPPPVAREKLEPQFGISKVVERHRQLGGPAKRLDDPRHLIRRDHRYRCSEAIRLAEPDEAKVVELLKLLSDVLQIALAVIACLCPTLRR